MRNLAIAWVNAYTGEITLSAQGMEYEPQNISGYWKTDSADYIYAIGYAATYAEGNFVYNFWNTTWNGWDYVLTRKAWMWAPAIDQATIQPVRMTNRDDGVGTGENHPRLQNTDGSKASSVAGTKIMGNGDGTYR